MNVTHRASSNQRRGLQIHSTHRSPHPIRALLEEANERDFRSNQGITKNQLEVSGYVGGGVYTTTTLKVPKNPVAEVSHDVIE